MAKGYRIIEEEGTISDAITKLSQVGGKLTTSKNRSTSVILSGNKKILFIHDKQEYSYLPEIARMLGIKFERGMTENTIVKKFFTDIIKLDPTGTYFGQETRKFARLGKHWGYYHFTPHDDQQLIELDVRSAYFSCLLSLPSLNFKEPFAWRNSEDPVNDYTNRYISSKSLTEAEFNAWGKDNGAMARLRSWEKRLGEPDLKQFRLKVVGVLASHQYSYSCWDKEKNQLVEQTCHEIRWGGAFNAVQIAVAKNFHVSKRCCELFGEHIVRWHTDGGIFKASTPGYIQREIMNFFAFHKLSLRCKGFGHGKFYDLNTGFLGAELHNFRGVDTFNLIKKEKIKINKFNIHNQFQVESWGLTLVTHGYKAHDRNCYGYFQHTYAPGESGEVIVNGGYFYCFCCPLSPENDNQWYQRTELKLAQLKNITKI